MATGFDLLGSAQFEEKSSVICLSLSVIFDNSPRIINFTLPKIQTFPDLSDWENLTYKETSQEKPWRLQKMLDFKNWYSRSSMDSW